MIKLIMRIITFQRNRKGMSDIEITSIYQVIFKKSRSISGHKKNGHTFMYPFQILIF
jgi:hypothetical protein